MLNIGAGEIVLILVVALLVLGPKRLPELARGIGKFLREFRRQTDEVRSVVEREFYKMDEDLEAPARPVLPEGAHPAAPPAQAPPAEAPPQTDPTPDEGRLLPDAPKPAALKKDDGARD